MVVPCSGYVIGQLMNVEAATRIVVWVLHVGIGCENSFCAFTSTYSSVFRVENGVTEKKFRCFVNAARLLFR